MQPDYLNNINDFIRVRIGFILFAMIAGFLGAAGCEESKTSGNQYIDNQSNTPMIMVVKNQSNDYSREVSAQIQKSLDYSKLPFFTVDLGIISQDFSIPKTVRSIVITTEKIQELTPGEIEELITFVARGNSIVFVGPIISTNFSFLQGLKPDAGFSTDTTNVGFRLLKNAFPGMKNKTYNPKGLLPHFGLTAESFSNEVEILATSASDRELPFIVSNKIGLGETILLNSYAISGKTYRGILFSAILRGLEGIPYQVANVSTIFLDDFPAPLYNEKLPPIDEEYDVTHAEFVTRIWWPDMKALADTFDISYSAMTAFNYNANVVPPFDFREWRQGSIIYNENIIAGSIFLAENIRDSRHELAFHGYNHFSLWKKDWENMNFMISALQAARKRWSVDNLGPLPTNYVPPTNQIDSIGLQALIRGMPSTKYMSSLYFGDIWDGGGREFDPDPYVPGQLFNYPRISSGFTMDDNSLFDQQGLQLLTGIWNHFVHPDDVFQVNQRGEDEFASRNPLGLGWKSDPEFGYGLYHILRDRIVFTKKYYPNNKFITATEGAQRTEDWRRRLSDYTIDKSSILITSSYRQNDSTNNTDRTKHWFMYVKNDQVSETESVLNMQNLDYDRSGLWDGYLYQIATEKDVFFVPNFDESLYYDQLFVENIVREQLNNFDKHRVEMLMGDSEEWTDTRLEEAIKTWKRNPDSFRNQENLIALSIEFGQVAQAISILENRLLEKRNWRKQDKDRLLEYYGWEGMQPRAELFLERLWEKYHNARVIEFKKQAITALGLYGEEFERRWRLRELQLNPDDYELLLAYTKALESPDTWPKMKENLRRLLEMRPQTDSLYAFTVQRSIYYESADSTMNLVEEFPTHAYSQLIPFAADLSFMYGFEAEEYEKALFWANNAPDFDEQLKLYWLAELDLDALYKAKAIELITNNPEDDSLRSFVGTNLFYQGFYDDSYQVLYPLFKQGREDGLVADTLLKNEIGYMGYEQKKEFYREYPKFFDADQEEALQADYRRTEGVRVSAFGEYRDDNFNNTFARGGISIQLGNRQKNTHIIKPEYLVFSDDEIQSDISLTYQGIGYEFTHRSNNQQFEFRAGPSVLFGEGDYIPEGLISIGFSQDSSYTSFQLTGGAELTSTALQNDYYQTQLQVYRQDFWFSGNAITSLSATGKYYTNEVFRYGGQGRFMLNLMDSKWKVRPLAELGYDNATQSFISGIPYYTPDQYFSQGVGLDVQFRNPDSFDYRTQFSGEVMGKHERREGIFLTGRVQFEHKFRNFWEFSVGTEVSTSRVYRSNRIFFTISHYFPKKLKSRK